MTLTARTPTAQHMKREWVKSKKWWKIEGRLTHETYSGRSEKTHPKSLIFSEESIRIIHELCNIELYELGQMSSTIQCHSCFNHMPKGLAFCPCAQCLRRDEATIRRIHARKL